jgi:2-methylcitrate dehydratase PrpD
MSDGSVSERLVAFVRQQTQKGIPEVVLHEAKRLLVNQLKASVGAMDHPAVCILHDWAREGGPPTHAAHVLWFGTTAQPEQAAAVNGALFEVLDFNETYIPCFMHAVSGVLPSVLAAAEVMGVPGAKVLEALALGIEVELACAAILMPTGYFRGFIPGGLTGAIGGGVACSLLMELDDAQMRNAIGLAMNSGMGFYQSAGSMALPYVMAMTARSGLTIAKLAAKGMDAPITAFEGDKGMLSAYSDEPATKIDAVLSTLGQIWRIMGQSYKTVPTETITHGPIECVMALRARAGGRVPAKMTFGVEAIVVKIADERAKRFGAPSNDLEAKFDLRHCTAAAWVRGRFTLAEMKQAAFTDPAILDLRARTELVADPQQKTFDGAALTIDYQDGTSDQIFIPNFRGTPGNPMTDDELSDVFRLSAEGVLTPERADQVLEAAWGLSTAPDVRKLMSLAAR